MKTKYFNPETNHPPLPLWVRRKENNKLDQDHEQVMEILHRLKFTKPKGTNEFYVIVSYSPVLLLKFRRQGQTIDVVEIQNDDLTMSKKDNEFRNREEFGFHIWEEKIKISLGKPTMLSMIETEEYTQMFRYVYWKILQKFNRDERFVLYLDGNVSNKRSGNMVEYHAADALTTFVTNNYGNGYIEVFDEYFRGDLKIMEFIYFSACVLWYFFGLVENDSIYPVTVEPGYGAMSNAHEWFNHPSFKALQIAKRAILIQKLVQDSK